MKAYGIIIKGSLTLILYMLLLSCDHKPDFEYFLIKVDSIQVPGTIYANTPFDISFFGTIGTSGCSSFSDFNKTQTDSGILIEAWGKVDANAKICPTVMVYLTGQKITCTIDTPGNYTIRIKQPDNSYLERQITVN